MRLSKAKGINPLKDSKSVVSSSNTVRRKSNKRVSVANAGTKKSSKLSARKSIQELPPCQFYRTRSSLDYIRNPIDQPAQPTQYKTPFRRDWRYFGYPHEINLEVQTPPRAKSWGSIEENVPNSNRHKRRAPTSHNFRATQGDDFDPHWLGRMLRKNLLLHNPGLIPPTDKAASMVGNQDKLKLIHPDFIAHNCPSDLYFPISDMARKAFCRINKTIDKTINQQVRAYTVQNPTLMKFAAAGMVMQKDEQERMENQPEKHAEDTQKSANLQRKSVFQRKSTSQEEISAHLQRKSVFQRNRTSQEGLSAHLKRKSVFRRKSASQERRSEERRSLLLSEATIFDENLIYDYDVNTASPVIKTMCIEDNYPGMNRQLYERPRHDDDSGDLGVKKHEDILIYGVARVPNFSSNVPDDIWTKLAKVRQRQQQLDKHAKAKAEVQDPDSVKFETFTQLQLRNQVLTKARNDFVNSLKKGDLYAPLPAALFKDNRDFFQPVHDFFGKGELPAQGPFYWKIPKEEPPNEEEMAVVEKFIEDAKDLHSYTHHLPGLLYTPRHPYQPLEMDWLDKDTKTKETKVKQRAPSELHAMPAYIFSLDREEFHDKFLKTVNERAKELVGPEIYELYKKTYGIVEKTGLEHTESTEEIPEKVVPVSREMRRIKRRTSRQKQQGFKRNVGDGGDETEEEEEEGEEKVYEIDEEVVDEEEIQMLFSPEQAEPEYKLSTDLLEEDQFPMPDVHFSLIKFPKTQIPEGLKDDVKFYRKWMERAEVVRSDDEETKHDSDGSDTTTESEGKTKEPVPAKSRDPVSHLKVMYKEAVIKKLKGSFTIRPPRENEFEPPKLRDVFLMETYTEDIEELLNQTETIPKFLQLF